VTTPKSFTEMHLPVAFALPRVEDNLPRAAPWPPPPEAFSLGPSERPADPTLIDAYLRGDLRVLVADSSDRPDHYTPEQHVLITALHRKQPLPPGTTTAALNELVLRYTERSEQKKMRAAAVSSAQRKLDGDPTVKRKQEEDSLRSAQSSFEEQGFPKAIKII
jgi:hypothetical protein